MSNAFQQRLFPHLDQIAAHFGTPFHLYDEAGIRATGQALQAAFSGVAGFREYFAVKALPNPRILSIVKDMGFGFDCSSIPELILARQVGARGEEIMFTSNNTSPAEFDAALADCGCILNLDDLSLIDKLPQSPRSALLSLQPRRAANRQRDHRQAGGSQVRRQRRPDRHRLPPRPRSRRAALRAAHDAGLQRARLSLHGRDDADAARPRGASDARTKHSLRIYQHRRRLRDSLSPGRRRRSTSTRWGVRRRRCWAASRISTVMLRRCTWRAVAT